jgi:hypothetical protein
VVLLAVGMVLTAGCKKEQKPAGGEGTPKVAKPAGDFANVRCPIMGSTIKPKAVTADLTREFEGKKIAFCCAGCPEAWDKLDDAAKTTKLAAVAKK